MKRALPFPRRHPSIATITVFALVLPLAPAAGQACGPVYDRSDGFDMSFGSETVRSVFIGYFDPVDTDELQREARCEIYVSVPLSAFPSISARMTTAELASRVANRIEGEPDLECGVRVYYEDDVESGLTERERCVQSIFSFDGGRERTVWSEEPCLSEEQWAEILEQRRRWQEEEEERLADQSDVYEPDPLVVKEMMMSLEEEEVIFEIAY